MLPVKWTQDKQRHHIKVWKDENNSFHNDLRHTTVCIDISQNAKIIKLFSGKHERDNLQLPNPLFLMNSFKIKLKLNSDALSPGNAMNTPSLLLSTDLHVDSCSWWLWSLRGAACLIYCTSARQPTLPPPTSTPTPLPSVLPYPFFLSQGAGLSLAMQSQGNLGISTLGIFASPWYPRANSNETEGGYTYKHKMMFRNILKGDRWNENVKMKKKI